MDQVPTRTDLNPTRSEHVSCSNLADGARTRLISQDPVQSQDSHTRPPHGLFLTRGPIPARSPVCLGGGFMGR